MITETLPYGTGADTAMPQATQTDGTITWQKLFNSGEKGIFSYYLNLPDLKGSYTVNTDIRYTNNLEINVYGSYALTLDIPYDSSGLLQTIIAEVGGLAAKNRDDAEEITEALTELSSIEVNVSNREVAEENIERITAAIEAMRMLSIDVSDIRLKLDELLRIWQKKWYTLGQ
jgi:hypothetical protein